MILFAEIFDKVKHLFLDLHQGVLVINLFNNLDALM